MKVEGDRLKFENSTVNLHFTSLRALPNIFSFVEELRSFCHCEVPLFIALPSIGGGSGNDKISEASEGKVDASPFRMEMIGKANFTSFFFAALEMACSIVCLVSKYSAHPCRIVK
jgi:hypothetical protein